MKITVIGTGYVGLITGLCLSSLGNEVTCIDINISIVQKLNNGLPTIFEDGLEDLLKSELSSKRFKVSMNIKKSISESETVFIAVGTPSLENGEIDLSYIEKALITVSRELRNINRYISIVIKSTVLPTTTDTFIRKLIEKYSGKKLGQFGLGMNPEFLREGSAINDFMNPDRIIIGTEDFQTQKNLEELYKNFNCEKILVNTRTAELIKYANNSLLALLISATNEISNLSALIGKIDIKDVMRGVKLDKRWNPIINNKRIYPGILEYLNPGCGFGGSCLPKDVSAFIKLGLEKGKDLKIMKSILDVNINQPKQIIIDLEEIIDLHKKKILILGLSFKPGTDDVRMSPSLSLVRELSKQENDIYAHDPVSIDNFKKEINLKIKIHYCKSWDENLKEVDIVILLTGWDMYKKIYGLNLKNQIIYDARRILKKEKLICKRYLGLGYRD